MDSHSGLPADTVLDGNYRIERLIGSGGLSITYEAEDIHLGTKVAIKEYFPFDFAERDATMRVKPKSDRHRQTFDQGRSNFLQEARALARFEHPSIVRVTRVFEANSTAYVVMRLEQGQSFEAWLKELGRLPTQEELDRIVAPLLDALEILHAADLLHRDIAPGNIIVRADGTPVLLDFSAARRAVEKPSRNITGVVKSGYSPHEQYSSDGRLQGPWSDIYALGATLYRAVTGHPPEEATLRVDGDGLPPATLAAVKGKYRKDFLRGIDACLQVRHADRPRSAAQARELLLGRGSHPSAAAERPVGAYKPTSKVGGPPASAPHSSQSVGNAVTGAAKLIVALPVLVVGAAGAAVIGTGKLAKKLLTRQTQRKADAPPRPEQPITVPRPASPISAARPPPPISVASGATMPESPPSDVVQCSVFAPPKAAPATAVLVQVFLHAPAQAAQVETIARAFDDTSSKRQFATLPVPLQRGARVDVSLVPSGLEVEEPHQLIVWRGETEAANFLVKLPADAGKRVFFPIVLVSVNGVPHGRLIFKLSSEVGAYRGQGADVGQHAMPYRRAFCSYSSENSIEVARCVQVLNVLGYDCFHDKSTLKPGQNFEEALWNEVRQRELFLLFWSYAAQRSDWVRREAQWAVEAQTQSLTQVPDILPIILDGPPPPPPYEFLSDRHFDDRFQYMISALKLR